MKTSQFFRFAGIFTALILVTGVAISGNNRGRFYQNNGQCINQISGLNQDQRTKITVLQQEHQKVMDELRQKRRSTTDFTQKEQVREEMNAEVLNYRNNVRSLLNASQQAQFDAFASSRGNQKNFTGQGGQRQGRGKGQGKGQGPGNCGFNGLNGPGPGVCIN